MLKKSLSLLLVGSLIYAASAQPVLAQSTANKQDQVTENVKAQILHLGVGEKSHVKVKLRNNTHVNGYISKAARIHSRSPIKKQALRHPSHTRTSHKRRGTIFRRAPK